MKDVQGKPVETALTALGYALLLSTPAQSLAFFPKAKLQVSAQNAVGAPAKERLIAQNGSCILENVARGNEASADSLQWPPLPLQRPSLAAVEMQEGLFRAEGAVADLGAGFAAPLTRIAQGAGTTKTRNRFDKR